MPRHLTRTELEAGLPDIMAAPADEGVLEGHRRSAGLRRAPGLASCEISLAGGVHGDRWADGCWMTTEDGRPHPDVQICIMSARCIGLIAQERANWPPAGDNLFVDMDLSPGQHAARPASGHRVGDHRDHVGTAQRLRQVRRPLRPRRLCLREYRRGQAPAPARYLRPRRAGRPYIRRRSGAEGSRPRRCRREPARRARPPPGAPHPRETAALFGQEAAERAFLAAEAAGRLHHAWLLTGPRGVGKATLAWRIARHLVAGERGPTLDMAPDHPVFRQVAALASPQLFLCRRPWDDKAERLRTAITVDEVRGAQGLLPALRRRRRPPRRDRRRRRRAERRRRQRAPEDPRGAARRAPCSCSSATARPALLPTLRSRCRELRCRAARRRAAGRAPSPPPAPPPGRRRPAGGPRRRLGRRRARPRSRAAGSRSTPRSSSSSRTAPARPPPRSPRSPTPPPAATPPRATRLTLELVRLALGRLALRRRRRARPRRSPRPRPSSSPGSAPRRRRPGSGRACVPRLAERAAHARAVNLDPAQVILDTFLQIDAAAAEARAHAA